MKGNPNNSNTNGFNTGQGNNNNNNNNTNPNTKQLTVYRRKNPLNNEQQQQQQEKLQYVVQSQQMYQPQQLKEQQPGVQQYQQSYQTYGTKKSQSNVVYTPVNATLGVDSKGNSQQYKKQQKGNLIQSQQQQQSPTEISQQQQEQPQQEGIQEDTLAVDNYLSKSACLLDQTKPIKDLKKQELLQKLEKQQQDGQCNIQKRLSNLELAFMNNNRGTILVMITLGPSEEMQKLYLIGLNINKISVCEHCEFNITEICDIYDHFNVIQRKISVLARKSDQLIISFAWETKQRLLADKDIFYIQHQIPQPALVLESVIPENYLLSGQIETNVLVGDLLDPVLDQDIYLATKVLSYFNSLEVQQFTQVILKLAKEHVELSRLLKREEISEIQDQVKRCIQEAKENKNKQQVGSLSSNDSNQNSFRDNNNGVEEVKNENRNGFEEINKKDCIEYCQESRRDKDLEDGIVLSKDENDGISGEEGKSQEEINGLKSQENRDYLEEKGEDNGDINSKKNEEIEQVEQISVDRNNNQQLEKEEVKSERIDELNNLPIAQDQLENKGQLEGREQQKQQYQDVLIENVVQNKGFQIQNIQGKEQKDQLNDSNNVPQILGDSDNSNNRCQQPFEGDEQDAFDTVEMQIIRLLQNLKQERKATLDQSQLLSQKMTQEREQRIKLQLELQGIEQLVSKLKQDNMEVISENVKLTQLNKDLQEDNLRSNEQIKIMEETQRESEDMVLELKARDRQNIEELDEKNKSLDQQKQLVKKLTDELSKKSQIIETLEAGRMQLDNQLAAERETAQYLSVKAKRQEQDSKIKEEGMKRLEEESKINLATIEGLMEDIKQKDLNLEYLGKENALIKENLKQIEECLLKSEEKTNIIELEVSKKAELMENLKLSLQVQANEIIEGKQKNTEQQMKMEEQERQLEELKGQLQEKENSLREFEEERMNRAAENERQQIALQEASKLLMDCSQALLQKNSLSVSQMRESFTLNQSVNSQSNSSRNINSNNGNTSSNGNGNQFGGQIQERILDIQDTIKDTGKEDDKQQVQQTQNIDVNQEQLKSNKDGDDKQNNQTGVMHVGEHSKWSWDEDKDMHEGQEEEEDYEEVEEQGQQEQEEEQDKQVQKQDDLKCHKEEISKDTIPDVVVISPKDQQISEGCCSDLQQSQVKNIDTNNSQQVSEDDELILQLQGALTGNGQEIAVVAEVKDDQQIQKGKETEEQKDIIHQEKEQLHVVHTHSKQKKLKDRMMNVPPSKPYHFQNTTDNNQQTQQQSLDTNNTVPSNNLQDYLSSLQQQQDFASVFKDDLSMFEQTAQMKQLFASPPKNLFEENPFISAMMQQAQEYAKRGQLQQQQQEQQEQQETASLPLSSKVPNKLDFQKGTSSSRSYYSEGSNIGSINGTSQRRSNGWISRVQRLNGGKYKGSNIVREQGVDDKEKEVIGQRGDKDILDVRERRWERKNNEKNGLSNIKDERKENKIIRTIEDEGDEDDGNDSFYDDENGQLFSKGKKYLTQQLSFKYIRKTDKIEGQQVKTRVAVNDEIKQQELVDFQRTQDIRQEDKQQSGLEQENDTGNVEGVKQQQNEEDDYSYQEEDDYDEQDHSNDKDQIIQQDKPHLVNNYIEDHRQLPTNTVQDQQIQQSEEEKLDCCNNKSHFNNINANEYLNIYELIGVGQVLSAKQAAEVLKERQDHATQMLRKRQQDHQNQEIPQQEDTQMLVALSLLVNEEIQPAEVTQITASVINTDNAQIIDEFDQLIVGSQSESKPMNNWNQSQNHSKSLNSRTFSFSYSTSNTNQQGGYIKPFSKNAKRQLSSESRYQNTNNNFNAKNKEINFNKNYTSDIGNSNKNNYYNNSSNYKKNNSSQYITAESSISFPPSKGFAYGFAKLCNFLKQFLDNYKCTLILESQSAKDLLHDCFIKYRVLPCSKHFQIFYSCLLLQDIFPSSLSGLQSELTSIFEAAQILKIERKSQRKGNYNNNTNINPWNQSNQSDAKIFGKVISALLTKGITVLSSMIHPTFESENLFNQAGKYIENISQCFKHNHVFVLLSFQPGRDQPKDLGSSVVSISVLARDNSGNQFIHLAGALGLQYDFYRCDVSPFYFYFISYLAALNIQKSQLTFLSIAEHEILTLQFLDLINYHVNNGYHHQNNHKQFAQKRLSSQGQARQIHNNSIALSEQLSSFIEINLDSLIEKFKPQFDFKQLFHALMSENMQLESFITSGSAAVLNSSAQQVSSTLPLSSIQSLLKKLMSQ